MSQPQLPSRSPSRNFASSGPATWPRCAALRPPRNNWEALIQTCAAFSLAIKSQVEQETKAWVLEFQTNLSQLEKDLQAKADEAKAKTKPAAAGGPQ